MKTKLIYFSLVLSIIFVSTSKAMKRTFEYANEENAKEQTPATDAFAIHREHNQITGQTTLIQRLDKRCILSCTRSADGTHTASIQYADGRVEFLTPSDSLSLYESRERAHKEQAGQEMFSATADGYKRAAGAR